MEIPDHAEPPNFGSERDRAVLPPPKVQRVGSNSSALVTKAVATSQSMKSVVLIEVCSTSPNYISPWKMHSQKSCKGSGFVIEGRRIITNFHVVQDAIDVRLRKHGVSRRWRGKVLVEAHDVDLALLTVHEEEDGNGDSFWQDVTPATWCDLLPELQSPVHVVGFPTGGQTISVTQGVVSRIDCKASTATASIRSDLPRSTHASCPAAPCIGWRAGVHHCPTALCRALRRSEKGTGRAARGS